MRIKLMSSNMRIVREKTVFNTLMRLNPETTSLRRKVLLSTETKKATEAAVEVTVATTLTGEAVIEVAIEVATEAEIEITTEASIVATAVVTEAVDPTTRIINSVMLKALTLQFRVVTRSSLSREVVSSEEDTAVEEVVVASTQETTSSITTKAVRKVEPLPMVVRVKPKRLTKAEEDIAVTTVEAIVETTVATTEVATTNNSSS